MKGMYLININIFSFGPKNNNLFSYTKCSIYKMGIICSKKKDGDYMIFIGKRMNEFFFFGP